MTYVSDYYAYQVGRELSFDDHSFYGLVMAAMRKADTGNLARLKAAFPEVWVDLEARYNAPGGVLPTDPPSLREHVIGQSGGDGS